MRPKPYQTIRPHKGTGEARSAKIWRVVNSPIFLLMISTVLISGLGKLYSDHEAAIVEQRNTREEKAEILLEIASRQAELHEIVHEYNLTHGYFGKISLERCVNGLEVPMIESAAIYRDEDRPDGIAKLSITQTTAVALKSVMNGTAPYAPTQSKYVNDNLIGLLYKLDTLSDDHLGDSIFKTRKEMRAIGLGIRGRVPLPLSEELAEIQHSFNACSMAASIHDLETYVSLRRNDEHPCRVTKKNDTGASKSSCIITSDN